MNYAIVRYVIGYVLYFEAAFMVPPCINIHHLPGILRLVFCDHTGLLCVLLGFILTHKKHRKTKSFIRKKDLSP